MNVSHSHSVLSVCSTDSDVEKRVGAGKHVRKLSLLPSALAGRIKVEKVCGEDKRRAWLTETGRMLIYIPEEGVFRLRPPALLWIPDRCIRMTHLAKRLKYKRLFIDIIAWQRAMLENDFSSPQETIMVKWVTEKGERKMAELHTLVFQFQRHAERPQWTAVHDLHSNTF